MSLSLKELEGLEKDIIPNSIIFAIEELYCVPYDSAKNIFLTRTAKDEAIAVDLTKKMIKQGEKYLEKLPSSERTALKAKVASKIKRMNNLQ